MRGVGGEGAGAHLVHEIVDGVGRRVVESEPLGAALVTLRVKTCQSVTPLNFCLDSPHPHSPCTFPPLQLCPTLYETE